MVGTRNVGSVGAGYSAVTRLQANLSQPDVWFDAEIVALQKQPDADSTPGNGVITEDDYTAACFSVPGMLYSDEELTVTLPEGFENTVWTKDNQPPTTTPPDSGVFIHPNVSLPLRTPATSRFPTNFGNFLAGG